VVGTQEDIRFLELLDDELIKILSGKIVGIDGNQKIGAFPNPKAGSHVFGVSYVKRPRSRVGVDDETATVYISFVTGVNVIHEAVGGVVVEQKEL